MVDFSRGIGSYSKPKAIRPYADDRRTGNLYEKLVRVNLREKLVRVSYRLAARFFSCEFLVRLSSALVAVIGRSFKMDNINFWLNQHIVYNCHTVIRIMIMRCVLIGIFTYPVLNCAEF